MLYCNDELVQVTDVMRKRVYHELGIADKKGADQKFKMVIKMPTNFYSQSEGNEKPDRPAVAVIPMSAQVEGQNGSEMWRYCNGRDHDQKAGKFIYYSTFNGRKQGHLEYADSLTIDGKNIDLIYFLLFYSKLRLMPGETAEQAELRGIKPSQRFQFVVENKEREAATKISNRQKIAKVELAILEGLPKNDLVKVAMALGLSNSGEKGELELRDEVLSLVIMLEKKGHKGYDKFIEVARLDEKTQIKTSIQKAIDLKLIKEDQRIKKFVYLTDEGKNSNIICGTYAGMTLRESLEHYLETEPAAFDKLEIEISEKDLINEEAQ